MRIEPLTSLKWAYQLHYYLCFRTHRRRTLFAAGQRADSLSKSLTEICSRHAYHLLQSKIYPDHLRCLVSLRPEQTISNVLQTLKSNLARGFCAGFDLLLPLWARGYLARSTGRVRVEAVRRYLEGQTEHHGYANRVRPPVFGWRAPEPVPLRVAHAAFELGHHLVLSTRYRRGVFDSTRGGALATYWLTVATQRGFAIDQVTIVPDQCPSHGPDNP
jgi:REP element-mobilizing transposase RayT